MNENLLEELRFWLRQASEDRLSLPNRRGSQTGGLESELLALLQICRAQVEQKNANFGREILSIAEIAAI